MSKSIKEAPSESPVAVDRLLLISSWLIATMVLSLFLMSAMIRISGAVMAPGTVEVSSNVKRIQHPTGGVVSGLRVRDGSHVKAGDILLTLDDTATGASAAITRQTLAELTAREARLTAERDGGEIPAGPFNQDSFVNLSFAAERRLLALHRAAQQNERAQQRQRVLELNAQISGIIAEATAKRAGSRLIEEELVGVRQLYKENLVPLSRLNSLERDLAQLQGDIAQEATSLAEARGKIAEIRYQGVQVDETAKADAGTQLGDVEGHLVELRQKEITSQQDLRRIQIRAPQDGTVDRLAVHTIGGVISAGEQILLIVPSRDVLRVGAKLRASDVDKVKPGQTASLRLTAFDQRITPEVAGVVSSVSAEAELEEKTGAQFYVVQIDISPTLPDGVGKRLIPGMPVEVFFQTGSRTVLSFLTKPLVEQIKHAFRG